MLVCGEGELNLLTAVIGQFTAQIFSHLQRAVCRDDFGLLVLVLDQDTLQQVHGGGSWGHHICNEAGFTYYFVVCLDILLGLVPAEINCESITPHSVYQSPKPPGFGAYT